MSGGLRREGQMPAERLSMWKIKEVLQLKWACALSNRQTVQGCALGRPTVAEYLRQAKVAGLALTNRIG